MPDRPTPRAARLQEAPITTSLSDPTPLTDDRLGTSFRLVVLGRPGSGKGTLCTRLAESLHLVHLSTGDLLRAAIRGGTPLGRRVESYLEAGDLVPDELVVDVVAQRLTEPGAREQGWLLDGFPRTVPQADALAGRQGAIDAVIDLDVPAAVVVRRLAARRVCSQCGWVTTAPAGEPEVPCEQCGDVATQRTDDTEAAIERRLALYDEQTRPVSEWYRDRGLLVQVDGQGGPDDVFARVLGRLLPHLETPS